MKKLHILYLLLFVPLLGFGQGARLEGKAGPCPNTQFDYTYTADLTVANGITVHLTNGRFTTGETSKSFASGKKSYTFGVKWNDSHQGHIRVDNPAINLSTYMPISIQTLISAFPTLSIAGGNGTFYGQNGSNFDPVKTIGLNIPKGAKGNVTIKATAYYPDVRGELVSVENFRWFVNGEEITNNRSNKFTIQHDEINSPGTITVYPKSKCTDASDGKPFIIYVSRKEIVGSDVVNIQNQTISAARNVFAVNTINITNTNINNNANVNFIAGGNIIIKPNSKFSAGTQVRIWATGEGISSSTRSVMLSEDIEDSSSIEDVATNNSILLYPNPSDGIFYIKGIDTDCNINVYNISGQLVYSAKNLKDGENIDLSGKAKGMYQARITIGDKVITQKLVIR